MIFDNPRFSPFVLFETRATATIEIIIKMAALLILSMLVISTVIVIATRGRGGTIVCR